MHYRGGEAFGKQIPFLKKGEIYVYRFSPINPPFLREISAFGKSAEVRKSMVYVLVDIIAFLIWRTLPITITVETSLVQFKS